MKGNPKHNTLRIIGGNWRSRKVSFPNLPQIRPTPDRVRETLFNWLQFDVAGAKCLELYAGSGILSIEALSRGAQSAVIVDQQPLVCRHIDDELTNLDCSRQKYQIIQQPAAEYLTKTTDSFDIVFLDPPFHSGELEISLQQITKNGLLNDDASIYVESPIPLNAEEISESWQIYRAKQTGQVCYSLLKPA